MSNNHNEPAFPRPAVFTQALGLASTEQSGMTLRDYFAAKAMQGLLASVVNAPIEHFATRAYMVADAMLKEREA